MLHVINEVTIDTCDIHQIKEKAEVKSNRWLLIQTICGSSLVHKINSTHAAIVKLDNLRNWNLNSFPSSKLIIYNSFFQGRWLKQYWRIIHPFASHCITWKRNSKSLLFICLSSIIFGICFLLGRTVPILQMPLWNIYSINFGPLKKLPN